jgi:simple sugar transport system permease protein
VGFDVDLPPVVHLLAALLAGIAGGAVWGGLTGWLKARTGAHEVITTIMLNYVALYFLNYLLNVSGFQKPKTNEAVSKPISGDARLPHLFGANLPVHLDLLIALAAAAGVWWLLTRSTLGFSLRAIGANQNAARTAGMNVERGYLVVMLISGALAGLVGCSQALGARAGGFDNSVDANLGFDAITVALLGQASPWGTVLAGLFFGALNAGRVVMNASTSTPSDVVNVMEAVIVLFIAAPALVRSIFRLRQARGGSRVSALAKGWNG